MTNAALVAPGPKWTDVWPVGLADVGDVNAVTTRRSIDDQGTAWFAARLINGTRIEWVGGVNPFVDDPEPCDFGPEAARGWSQSGSRTGRSWSRPWTCSGP